MKKKIMITVASLAALGAAVAGYLHFSGRTPFGHMSGEHTAVSSPIRSSPTSWSSTLMASAAMRTSSVPTGWAAEPQTAWA